MGKIRLKEMTMEDASDLIDIFLNPESTRYWLTKCMTKEEVYTMMKCEYLSYQRRALPPPKVVMLGEKAIGVCCFNESFDGIGRIGFILNRDYEHFGYMTQALLELIQEGFVKWDYHRIEALVFCENEKSKQTLRRVGFEFEGTMRAYLKQEEKLIDVDLFSRIRRESDEEGIVS